MKQQLLLPLFSLLTSFGLQAQVTQINSNNSLQFAASLSNTKAIYFSDIDQTIWVSDGTLGGTIQLSTDIKFEEALGSIAFLDGKLIFAGTTPATGTEVYITDGTPGGTILVSDINPGAQGSTPDMDVAVLNGFIYFTAQRPAEGRELWRTDGTPGGTTLVKDIVAGAASSNTPNDYHLFSNGTYLLFAAITPGLGIELWKSDGTGPGTTLLKDIHTGNAGADSSQPHSFNILNNQVFFAATAATFGEEIWKTDGTTDGTTILKDINPGIGSSTAVDIGVNFTLFNGFHIFNSRAYFTATDGTGAGQVWGTDGTSVNTFLLKDIVPGTPIPAYIFLFDAVNYPNKFIFPVSDGASRSELWESDGTPGGTVLFKSFSGVPAGTIPVIFIPFDLTTGGVAQQFYQGNKFFFMANTVTEGNELWISDGTLPNTTLVKDIQTGVPDGITSVSYIYTSAGIYFPANNGVNGLELWKSDGTSGGTSMVADIITGLPGSEPNVNFFLVNGKILFEANNGDDPLKTDLYAVDGTFNPLPVGISYFTVQPKSADAILNWRTSQEQNSKNFTIQRSYDGHDFQNIGTVTASGTSTTVQTYSFIDAGIINNGRNTLYYRLLVADIDGKSALSQVITLKLKNEGKWNVRLLTNPVSENIKVLLSGITQNVQVSIIDLTGKRLFTSSLSAVNGQISIPAVNLPGGRYILLTETGNERKAIQFVK